MNNNLQNADEVFESAQPLMGDVDGDLELGDLTLNQGDIYSGDVDGDLLLANTFGDLEAQGALTQSAKIGLAAAGAGLLGAGAFGVSKLMKSRKLKQQQAQANARTVASGRIPATTKLRFLDVKGGVIKVAPIQSDASFEAADRNAAIEQIHNVRPYATSIIVAQSSAGSITFTVPATTVFGVGATEARVAFFVVKVGGPLLNSVTNSAFNFAMTVKDVYGNTVDLGTTTIIATGNNAFNITLVVTPWVLVRSVPRPLQLKLSATAADLTVTITGLPGDNAKGTFIIPGRDDQATLDLLAAMR